MGKIHPHDLIDKVKSSPCSMCSEPVNGKRWVVLCNYGIGTEKASCISECMDILCWPTCAYQWIEGRMIGADVNMRLFEREFAGGDDPDPED